MQNYRVSVGDAAGLNPLDRRLLVDRFTPVDAAKKVVAVGSVGTRCLILLLEAGVDFYFRQLWDGKGKMDVETMQSDGLAAFAGLCGKTLARGDRRRKHRSYM